MKSNPKNMGQWITFCMCFFISIFHFSLITVGRWELWTRGWRGYCKTFCSIRQWGWQESKPWWGWTGRRWHRESNKRIDTNKETLDTFQQCPSTKFSNEATIPCCSMFTRGHFDIRSVEGFRWIKEDWNEYGASIDGSYWHHSKEHPQKVSHKVSLFIDETKTNIINFIFF